METCSNCERPIGNLESAHLFNNAVVCDACNTRLRAQPRPSAAPATAAVPYASPAPRTADSAVSTLIPYRNAPGLISYYLGIFSIIPCLGALLGIAAVILGIKGLKVAKANPNAKGAAHAWVGIICGAIFGGVWILLDVLSLIAMAAAASHPR